MVISLMILLASFAALIKGADLFVDGSSALAGLFKIPSVIIGLTVVAMGTSVPELAVSISAAVNGANEIAFSNVTGSNIFNLLAVLGVCALMRPMPIDKTILKRDLPVSVGVTVLVLLGTGLRFMASNGIRGVGMSDEIGILSRSLGIVLLVLFVLYMVVLVVCARGKQIEEGEDEVKVMPLWKCLLFAAIGIGLIVAGGHFAVRSARSIAAACGMSETLIGLTVVAVGTSLPELVTSVVASYKGDNGLAAGNAVGSNIFNILLILGVSGTISPIAVNFASLIDLLVLVSASVVTYVFAITRNINRVEGAVMVAFYIGHVVFAVVR